MNLSGSAIGSLRQEAEAADRKAKKAFDDSALAITQSGAAETSSSRALAESGKATASASNALALASGARREADSFEKDIVSAKNQAAEAEAHLAEARQLAANAAQGTAAITARLADRELTDEQMKSIAAKLRPYSGQEFDVTPYWDLKESLAIANRIADAMILGGWKYIKPEQSSFMLGGVAGVQVWIHPAAPDGVKKAAYALVAALNEEGITAEIREQNPKNPIELKIRLNVGTKQ